MNSLPLIAVSIFVELTLFGVATFFLFKWATAVMQKNITLQSYKDVVRRNAASMFFMYCSMRIEMKRVSIHKTFLDTKKKRETFHKLAEIQSHIPKYQQLALGNEPLTLEHFLSQDEIDFLEIVT